MFESIGLTWAPRLLSVLRIMTGLLLLQHGLGKLLHFPVVPAYAKLMINSMPGYAGFIELIGGALLVLGLFTRPAAFIVSGMSWKRVALEIGMGTDIRGGDYTKAAVRALRDALWHNSLTVAGAVGKSSDDMRVEVLIGVPQPDKVDTAQVLEVLPHGSGTVKVFEGGLEIMNEAGTDKTVIAQAAAIVRLDL